MAAQATWPARCSRVAPRGLRQRPGGAGSAAPAHCNYGAGEARMVHIPYSGAAPAQLGLLSGQVDLNFDNLAAAAANIRAGKLKALGRDDRPAFERDAGIADAWPSPACRASRWIPGSGCSRRPRTPANVVARLNEVFVECIACAGREGALRELHGRPGAEHAGAVRRLRQGRAGQVPIRRQAKRRADRVAISAEARYSEKMPSSTCRSTSRRPACPSASITCAGSMQASIVSQ